MCIDAYAGSSSESAWMLGNVLALQEVAQLNADTVLSMYNIFKSLWWTTPNTSVYCTHVGKISTYDNSQKSIVLQVYSLASIVLQV